MSEVGVQCPYCGKEACITSGSEIYPDREDLSELVFYICRPCNAYVGTHKKNSKPLGRLANKELRDFKKQAHKVFDLIWMSGKMTRTESYSWLSTQLGVKPKDCHIGMFDIEMCQKVIQVCKDKVK